MSETPETPLPFTLGRKIQFDERSRNFPVRTLLPVKPLRSYTWRCFDYLDQGADGSCVGFSWTHELAARPSEVPNLNATTAFAVYKLAQTIDPWEGENYEGTSVLAGVKAVQKLHPDKITEYRWAFNLQDVLMTLSYLGPVVIGIPWYTGMFVPDADGLIKPTGWQAGGHAILVKGINIKTGLVRLHNSWGTGWGKGGDCFISFSDLDRLLREQGEACIAVKRGVEKRRAK
jgi:hypothetical protein